jgi:hypothetical protein
MPLQLTYYYSAGVKISDLSSAQSTSILCDPWFTSPIYHGSWYQFPPYTSDPLQTIGKVDAIFISHIHPDHYDPIFLQKYLKFYGDTPIFIQDRPKNYLLLKMIRDGFKPIPTKECQINSISFAIFPVDPLNNYEIDSALALKSADGDSILNLNDCNFDKPMLQQALNYLDCAVDILLLNYTPASSYPQCYNFSSWEIEEHKSKIKDIYLKKFDKIRQFIAPKLSIPFAGQYIIGGKNHRLNMHLGVCDAVEVASTFEDVVVLETNSVISTCDLKAHNPRIQCYSTEDILTYSESLASSAYDYESLDAPDLQEASALLSSCILDCLQHASANPFTLTIVSSDSSVSVISSFKSLPSPVNSISVYDRSISSQDLFSLSRKLFLQGQDYMSIYLTPKLLFAILIGFVHWNNVYVASLALFDRYPSTTHRKDIFQLLSLMKPMRNLQLSL